MRAQDILPDNVNTFEKDGVTLRKGSVAAFITNASLLRAADTTPTMREEAMRDIAEFLPSLRALGLFDVFEVRDPELRALVADRA